MTRPLRRSMLALVAIAVALLSVPAAAAAHATLDGTSPARGATVERQPAAVSFRFSEPVEGNFGALRVYDAAADRVEEGDAFHPGGEGSRLSVDLKPDLPEGSYTATYRVVSADGHIVSGGFVFSIGRAGRAPSETVAELVAAGGSGTATEIGLGVSRGVQYAALAIALGALVFFLLVWGGAIRSAPEGEAERKKAEGALHQRLRVVLLAAALAGFLSALGAVVFEAAQAAGVSAGAALDSTILREELGTRFGTVWAFTAVAWAVLGAGVLAVPPRRGGRAAVLLLPLAFVALEPALSGHPSTQSPVALLFALNVAHVLAVSVWVGGLASLLFVLPAATRHLQRPGRSRLLAACLARFSPLALASVALILVTGLAQGYAYVRHLDALLDSAYGRAILIKLVLLLGALVPLGAYNRYRSVPRLQRIAAGGEAPGRAGALVRRTLRAEVAMVAVVLGVTAALAGYAPTTTAQSGPFSDSARLGPAELEITVDPARVGSNQIHLYLFDAKTGAQFDRAKELKVTATLPDEAIGPLPLEPQRSGPGHYTVPGAQLGVAGDWRLEVTARVSAFDQFSSDVEVPIR